MINVRAIVKRRMKELGMKPYGLAKVLRGKVSAQTIYNFVGKSQAINVDKLGHVLSALGLDVVVRKDRK